MLLNEIATMNSFYDNRVTSVDQLPQAPTLNLSRESLNNAVYLSQSDLVKEVDILQNKPVMILEILKAHEYCISFLEK